jgi:spermidine synthase
VDGDAPLRLLEGWMVAAAALAFGLTLAFFPFGLMDRLVGRVAARFGVWGSHPIAFREGLTETVLYMRRDLLGEPLSFRLVTNAVPMAATGFTGERYMKLYVHWPVALRQDARRALLISYGVGSTAQALVGTRSIESIDVVDVSRDVLALSHLAFPPPEPFPLADPRVRVHIEDGRFFLLTTAKSYDLITGEPPPPRNAGIVSLYSQEYFTLIRSRLVEGGIATYWLPVFDLHVDAARSVIKGFCNAFPDCSLWTGMGLNWMLVGTRNLRGPVGEEAFGLQWRDPAVAPRLRDLALERPEQLGALFLADARDLQELTKGIPPLVDDHPRRLSLREPGPDGLQFYLAYMNALTARERFVRSDFIRSLWPAGLRERTLPYFEELDIFNRSPIGTHTLLARSRFPALHAALTRTSSIVLPLVIGGTQPREQAIVERATARGVTGPSVDYVLGLRELAARKYRSAAELFARVASAEPGFPEIVRLRVLALCLAADGAAARPLLPEAVSLPARDEQDRTFWNQLASECGGPAS